MLASPLLRSFLRPRIAMCTRLQRFPIQRASFSYLRRPSFLATRILRSRFSARGRILPIRRFCDSFLTDQPYTAKDRFYDIIHRTAVSIIVACCIFLIIAIGFLSTKIHNQHKRVMAQMKQVNFFRDVIRACPDIFEDLDPETLDVTPVYVYFVGMADENGDISIKTLMEDPLMKVMIDNSVPLDGIIDWGSMGSVKLEALTYMFCIVKYFSMFDKKDETKKLKRQIGDKMYKMMRSYAKVTKQKPLDKVTMKNLISWSECGFGLALLAAPDLGHMTLDEYMPLYVRGMLDDDELQFDEYVSRRSFDLIHKACDYHIGIRRIKRQGNKEARG